LVPVGQVGDPPHESVRQPVGEEIRELFGKRVHKGIG
jgi:hypothetical protein